MNQKPNTYRRIEPLSRFQVVAGIISALLGMLIQLFVAGQWVGQLQAEIVNIKDRLIRIERSLDETR